jgi:alpha,alpha-trehalose phosphorylase
MMDRLGLPSGFGTPESSQTLVNVTNGKLMRLLVDDEPFDVRYGTLRLHDRFLDFRAGTLTRTAEWTSPAGRTVRVTSLRFVSFTHRAIVGIAYEVEPLDGLANIVVQSELVANEQLPSFMGDPRVASALESPLQAVEQLSRESEVVLIHRTRRSGLHMAAAMSHVVEGSPHVHLATETSADSARLVVTDALMPGQRLRAQRLHESYGGGELHGCRESLRASSSQGARARRDARGDG